MALNIGKGLFSADKDIYGRKPVVPRYDPYASYSKTIGENIKLAPQAMKLADLTNQYNLQTRTGLFNQLMPGYSGTLDTIAGNLGSRARGELPEDVIASIGRQGAAWGITSGAGRAPVADYRNLRNYGLTSLDVSRQAEMDTANWLRTLTQTSLPEAVDIRDYSINPTGRLGEEFNRDWLAEQVAAGPDPALRGQFDSKMALLGMALSAYGGGAGYQGTYRPSYGGGDFGYGGGGGGSGGSWWSRMFRPNYAGPSAYQTGSYFGPEDEGPYY